MAGWKARFRPGDVVTLVSEYKYLNNSWPKYEELIYAGGNRGVIREVVSHQDYETYKVDWDGWHTEDGASTDGHCIDHYEDLKKAEQEVLASLLKIEVQE